jgi:hypothetical protein
MTSQLISFTKTLFFPSEFCVSQLQVVVVTIDTDLVS